MNNLEQAIEALGELLDELDDHMDIDENGLPDNAMRWANQLSDVSDALVRLKRHAKSDTNLPLFSCQQLLEALQPLRFDVWADHYEEDRLWYEPCEEGSFLYYDQVVAILKTQSKEQPQ